MALIQLTTLEPFKLVDFTRFLDTIFQSVNYYTLQSNPIKHMAFGLEYEGQSKSFEPDYLPLDFWAKKCYWP